jgi:hypothetical protein
MPMPNRFVSLLMACALGSASAALAQPAPPPPLPSTGVLATAVAPVTVTAAPLPPRKVIIQQSNDFVQHVAGIGNPERDGISRWYDPVCVLPLGLAPQQAAQLKARIEGVSRELGLRAAWVPKNGACKPNVEIVFTHQPQALMDDVASKREYLLGYYHFIERNRLKTITRPIQAWYVTATRSSAVGVAALRFANVSGSSRGFSTQFDWDPIDDPEQQSAPGCADRISNCAKSVIHNVLVVADSNALEGKDLGLVADYMIMLVLDKPRSLDGCNALPSVIDRFAASTCQLADPPNGLTPADASYLTGLYASDLELKKNFEQSDVTRRMAGILTKASADAKAH